MAIKIMLDAGHYTNYNQSPVYTPYKEGNMTFKLQTYLKAELQAYGFVVGVTKTSASQDVTLYNRGAKAKGYDLFLSLHSNACDTPSVKRVVIIKGYDQPNTLADKFGKCISEAMGITEKYQIMTRKGSSGGEYYGVLRGAKAVGVANRFILEHGFHTNKEVAQWLYQDANLKKLAKAIADMLAVHYGYKKTGNTTPTQPSNPSSTSYVAGVYKINTDTLNVRKEANGSSAIVTTVKKGESYTITEVKGEWGKLKSGAGWISLKYTVLVKATETAFKKYIVKTTDKLNGRKEASASSEILLVVPKGTAVTIVAEKMNGNTKWLKTASGYYLSASYTTFVRYV